MKAFFHWVGALFFYFAASVQIASLPQTGGWDEAWKALAGALALLMGTRQAFHAVKKQGDI